MHKKALWISDFKTSDHIGGAELVNEILIGYAHEYDVEVKHIHLHTITPKVVEEFGPDFVIVDSITRLETLERMNLMVDVFNKYPFFSLEHDYNKVSRHRHLFDEGDTYLVGEDPWCRFYQIFWEHPNRKMTFYMSHGQRSLQFEKIEEADLKFASSNVTVMSSCVYSREDLEFIDKLYERSAKRKKDHYLIFETSNPLKGMKESIAYAEENGMNYEFFSRLSPKQLLVAFAKAKGLVFMPTMHDVCPRITVESLLLGGDVHTNDYAQHHKEAWFTSGREICREYVEERPHYFWKTILSF